MAMPSLGAGMSCKNTNISLAECAQVNCERDLGLAALPRHLDTPNFFRPARRAELPMQKLVPVVSLPRNLIPSCDTFPSRIMIIGDDANILLVAALLLASGYEILTLEDVSSALNAFESVSDISLVLLHCNAPKSEACKASVRLRTRFPSLPIVRFGGKSESSGPAGRYFDYHHPEDHPIANLIRTVHVLVGRSDCDMD